MPLPALLLSQVPRAQGPSLGRNSMYISTHRRANSQSLLTSDPKKRLPSFQVVSTEDSTPGFSVGGKLAPGKPVLDKLSSLYL